MRGSVPPPSAPPATLQIVSPAAGAEWLEGETARISWRGTGPISIVQVSYRAERCPVGGRERGSISGWICRGTPPDMWARFQVPWLDSLSLKLTAVGLDMNGRKLAETERTVPLRPRKLADLESTAVAIIRHRQRLYFQREGHLVCLYVVSTGTRGHETPPMRPEQRLVRQGQAGRVFCKSRHAFSGLYGLPTPYWIGITAGSGIGLHATSPQYYDRLGTAASHGCVRLHQDDARELFEQVAVGTPAYVF